MESIQLTADDGHRLDADLLRPEEPGTAHGGVVVCHPHPQYGGDRFHPVVDALFRHLADAGFVALRFDFRSEFGGGVAERSDVTAALDELERHVDGGDLHLAGYSFGGVVALSTDDGRIASTVAVAPPLAVMAVPPPDVPVLVVVPEHDQFTPPAAAEAAIAAWPHAELRTVPGVDHFLLGRAAPVAEMAVGWLTSRR